jgi:hypothetical protein
MQFNEVRLLNNGAGVKKSGLFSESLKLNSIPFPPYLSIGAYELSILQSNAAGHQLTSCLAGPLFSISPH